MKKKGLHQDVYIGLVCIAMVIWFFWLNRNLPSDSALMPRLLSGILGGLSVLMVISGLKKSSAKDSDSYLTLDAIKVPFICWLFVAGYVVLFRLSGYFIATAVMLVALMRYMKRTSWKAIGLIAAIYLLLVYVFFVGQFGLNLWNLGLIGQLL